MKWLRDEFLELMTFGRVQRPMFSELMGPLVGLADEWRAQGATEDEIDLTAFEWDYVPHVTLPANCSVVGGPSIVLVDNDEEKIERDHLGRTMKLYKKTATIPLPLDFPVKTIDDWQKLRPRFLFSEDRIDLAGVEKARALRNEGYVVRVGIPGAFNTARELMGEEIACMAYYDQPEMMHDLIETMTTTTRKVLQRLLDLLPIDYLSVHEDFAGRNGPLVGPAQIDEYFRPLYSTAWEIARAGGAKVFMLDTDGNINSALDSLLACGLTAVHPMEPAAGMDIIATRAKYGTRLAMAGGIDKHVLRQGRAAIRKELEYKLQRHMWPGTVFGLDHRIPNGTPLEDYRYYVRLAREILGLPQANGKNKGWGRMAF